MRLERSTSSRQSYLQAYIFCGRRATVHWLERRSHRNADTTDKLLRREGFHLQKWLTIDPEVLASIPVEDTSLRFIDLSENKLQTDQAFGVTWDAQEDVFRFNALKQERATTKRTILSQSFSVWDPRGLPLPFSIRSKIILQSLNRLKKRMGWWVERGWSPECREWFKESELLETVQIPPFRDTNLHVLCDASQDAYGVCAYLRREFEDNVVECRLVAEKGRVASLKAQSICRLELMGTLVAARSAKTLAAELMTKMEKVTSWSDSTAVLHWIHQTSCWLSMIWTKICLM